MDRYKIDFSYTPSKGQDSNLQVDYFCRMLRAVRAIAYFIEVGEFTIGQELYDRVSPKDKHLFKKIEAEIINE